MRHEPPEVFLDEHGTTERYEPRDTDEPPAPHPDDPGARETSRRREVTAPLPRIVEADASRWAGMVPADIAFAIDALAPRGMVTTLTGEGGAGKSMSLQIAGTSTAARLPFFGKWCADGVAAAVFAEDPDQVLHIRQHRINAQLGIDYQALRGRFFPVSWFGRDGRLWLDRKPTPAMADLRAQLRDIERLSLVTLDNSALLYGGDESDRGEVSAFMQMLNGMADEIGAALILSAHPSKTSDATAMRASSGSTAWINASRAVLRLQAQTPEEPPSLTLVKANHSKPGERIVLEWHDAVLRRPAQPDSLTRKMRTRSLDGLIFDMVREAWEGGSPLSARPQASDRYLPRLAAARSDHRAQDVSAALTGWMASGHITYATPKGGRREGLRVAKERENTVGQLATVDA